MSKAALELWYWQCGGTSFSSQLYGLMAKADGANFARLASAFPQEAFFFAEWIGSETPKAFYEKYGVDQAARDSVLQETSDSVEAELPRSEK